MAIDIKRHKEKMNQDQPEIKLVPFIDILFTLLIFLVVTSSFGAAAVNGNDTGTGTGKPNMTDSTGDAEYYMIPVAGLQKVTVNGVDMSSEIRGNAIGVHANVLDQGDVQIKTKEHAIIIQAPPGMTPQQAVHSPE
ncbi:biopolymer transporter ExbD [uncultured Methanobrevibacter sp.]|uniref:ExbD/TolR family protein n=1 Tax=uncultured Methanobrevibacter sp. TaxID=253161 RepID=UPI0025EBC9AB|nr:biopolymer transporter ExbD [uncultured Methanobrevibacter sp.]